MEEKPVFGFLWLRSCWPRSFPDRRRNHCGRHRLTLHELADIGERGHGHHGGDFQRSRQPARPIRPGQTKRSSHNSTRKPKFTKPANSVLFCTTPGNLCLYGTAWWGWEDSNLQPSGYCQEMGEARRSLSANFDHRLPKRCWLQYLSGKLSGSCLGDQLSIGRSGRICGCLFETLKSLTFSNAGFDFVYSPCVLVSRRLQPLRCECAA
jgi:hypothetical protein